jgi:phosphotransferase system enzyme I (PtsI)
MVSSKDELLEVLKIFNHLYNKHTSGKKNQAKKISLGVLVEIPSLVLVLDSICPLVDYLSIGTNDLIQYTVAVDRTNYKVANLYEPLHPAVLRLIQQTIDCAKRHNKPVSMCGEMAGDPLYTALLLGMGLQSFSMGATTMPMVKQIIRHTNFEKAQKLAKQIFEFDTAAEIRSFLNGYMKKNYPDIFA